MSSLKANDTIPQRQLDRNFVLKFNPLGLPFLAINVHSEFPFQKRNSITFSVLVWRQFVIPYGFTGGFVGGGQLGYRRYYRLRERKQSFLEGFSRFYLIQSLINDAYDPGAAGSVGVGLIWGKQWEFGRKGVFELFAGPYYANSFPMGFDVDKADPRSVSVGIIKSYNPYNGLWLRAGVSIGRKF